MVFDEIATGSGYGMAVAEETSERNSRRVGDRTMKGRETTKKRWDG
jgi:hypothetical protein